MAEDLAPRDLVDRVRGGDERAAKKWPRLFQ
jgi:hypothetical protein